MGGDENRALFWYFFAMRLSTSTALGLKALSLAMDVGVMLLTPDGAVDFANPLVADLFGCSSVEELERHWPDLLPRFGAALGEASRQEKAVTLDLDLPEGKPRRLSFQVQRLREDECDAFLILARDRDLLSLLRNDLILASQLRSLALLHRAISHDLRAPLHSMALNLEVLRRSLDSEDDDGSEEREEQRETLGILREELERLNRSLHTLLAETTPSGTAREELDARDLLRDVERLLRPQARAQRVALSLSVGEEPLPLIAQRDRLKQALVNVALNAMEAMAEGGSLALEARFDAGQVEMTFHDSGPGIPERLRGQIFDLHFTTKESGTGIGLFVARSIAESHGGELQAESEEGKGSTFRFRLPAHGRPSLQGEA